MLKSEFGEKRPQLETRPNLTRTTRPETFKQFYWDKKELLEFCNSHSIPSKGGKIEIADRIEHFLRTGKIKSAQEVHRAGPWDSEKGIGSVDPVVNYKNDAATQAYFKSKIGECFHINGYLRAFAKQQNDGSLTYGDLVEGWKKAESSKSSSAGVAEIAPQFELNRFQRAYSSDPSEKRDKLKDAWRLVRSVAGEATYEHYKELVSQGITLKDILISSNNCNRVPVYH